MSLSKCLDMQYLKSRQGRFLEFRSVLRPGVLGKYHLSRIGIPNATPDSPLTEGLGMSVADFAHFSLSLTSAIKPTKSRQSQKDHAGLTA